MHKSIQPLLTNQPFERWWCDVGSLIEPMPSLSRQELFAAKMAAQIAWTHIHDNINVVEERSLHLSDELTAYESKIHHLRESIVTHMQNLKPETSKSFFHELLRQI